MIKYTIALITVISCVLSTGCAPKSFIEEGKADVKKPINCATATQDIQALQGEKVRVSQEIAAGATSIIPIGAVLNVLQLKELDQLEVGCGEYNYMIDQKISEIKKECNIQ